ncbi:MAG: transposase [Lentimonas sp.]|jgi:transposase
MSRTTIHAGLKELDDKVPVEKIRRAGAGRKPLAMTDPDILISLEKRIDPATRGDPESPLCWTSKSTTKLARELIAMGHSVSQRSVWNLMDELGYSMQSNRKSNEGSNHPD